jgi:hypothetical protein
VLGAISEEEFEAYEDALLDRLEELQEREAQEVER